MGMGYPEIKPRERICLRLGFHEIKEIETGQCVDIKENKKPMSQ